MIKLKLSSIQKADRPPQYYNDVISSGTISGGYVLLENDKYVELANKYREIKQPDKSPIENFKESMSRWVDAGLPVISDEEFDRRLSICRSCEFWKEGGNLYLGKCEKCGCTKFKLKLATESCPIGNW